MMKEQKSYITRQRLQVMECIALNREKHMTADEIREKLKKTGVEIGKSTVYRTLEKLMEEGRVRKYIADEGKVPVINILTKTETASAIFI